MINFAEIICPTPSIPKSGRIIEQTNRHNSGRKHQTRMYKVGALVRFACVPGHQLLGEASVICTENGTWSHPPPVCKFSYMDIVFNRTDFVLLLITLPYH